MAEVEVPVSTAHDDSILNTTKKILNISPDDDAFDLDITIFINSVFMTLNQLGLGPLQGFEINDAETKWAEYTLGDRNLNSVKSYMALRVRLMFDPPTSSFAIESFKKQCDEFEWRLTLQVDPPIVVPPEVEDD